MRLTKGEDEKLRMLLTWWKHYLREKSNEKNFPRCWWKREFSADEFKKTKLVMILQSSYILYVYNSNQWWLRKKFWWHTQECLRKKHEENSPSPHKVELDNLFDEKKKGLKSEIDEIFSQISRWKISNIERKWKLLNCSNTRRKESPQT